jgi:hypothetical protein
MRINKLFSPYGTNVQYLPCENTILLVLIMESCTKKRKDDITGEHMDY